MQKLTSKTRVRLLAMGFRCSMSNPLDGIMAMLQWCALHLEEWDEDLLRMNIPFKVRELEGSVNALFFQDGTFADYLWINVVVTKGTPSIPTMEIPFAIDGSFLRDAPAYGKGNKLIEALNTPPEATYRMGFPATPRDDQLVFVNTDDYGPEIGNDTLEWNDWDPRSLPKLPKPPEFVSYSPLVQPLRNLATVLYEKLTSNDGLSTGKGQSTFILIDVPLPPTMKHRTGDRRTFAQRESSRCRKASHRRSGRRLAAGAAR